MYGVDKLTLTEDVALVTFSKIPANLTLISEIFLQFGEKEINIDMISQAAPRGDMTSLSFSVSGERLVEVLELVNQFREKHPAIKPLIAGGNVKIQLFGEQMPQMSGVAARAIAALARSGCELMLTTTSEVDISFLVASAHCEDALAALREEFGVQ
ncbi:MAG: ACT domain-containing protein [Provencibacterium sp.]|jgi:aspartokinase|nr:ACT domain-containing protein [Provencibacterium sp.]